jgi:D-psicose/D-tagatose/L-ribulose 3-epimerase
VRFGASTFVWTSPFGDDRLSLFGRVAQLGFDRVEICIEDPALVSPDAVAAAAADARIGVLVCGAFGPDRDVSHEDPAVREAGIDYLRSCVDIAHGVGSRLVAGPMYSATGKARLLPPAERRQQWEWAVESLRRAGGYAATQGVTLAIEPLNRFETDLVNTVEQGVRLCEDIGADNVGLLLDTFHMNIEERDIGAAIRSAGRHVRHVHTCENDRGAPGSGHVDFAGVFRALDEIGYDEDVVIESFTPEIVEIARAVSMWRPLAPDGDTLASEGLAFLRDCHARAGAEIRS